MQGAPAYKANGFFAPFLVGKGAFLGVVMERKNNQTTGAGTSSLQKTPLKERFSAKRSVLMAMFVALSYVVSFLEFPIFPATPFLKLDFGNVFILLIAFLLGPIEGVIVCVLKESLRMIGTNSACVGELANMLVTSAYILLPSVVYQFKKGIKTVAVCLLAACFIGTAAALFSNRFITFPLYMGKGAAAAFEQAFWYIVGFNLIKTAAVGILTLLLYKRLSNFLKKMKI